MLNFTLAHLTDDVLLRDLAALVAQDRATTAILVAHVAEVDARRLYAPAGYTSMHAYCVEELHLSEDAAYRRIRAARAARAFPALFEALAEGRLHLAGICLLAPHLTQENEGELIAASTHRRKSDIEAWLARRFPLPEFPATVRAVPGLAGEPQLVPGRVEDDDLQLVPGRVEHEDPQLVPGRVGSESPGGFDHDASAAAQVGFDVVPGRPERFLVQVTIAKNTQEKLAYAQSLLSHAVPSGDVAQVLDRALDALIAQLERRKLGADARRQPRPSTLGKRYVPAPVRRAVWERDQGQCTFVSASGHRCDSRRFLQFDHVEPVARGGRATVETMRLRCRTHNQLEAERAFGTRFMNQKRLEAKLAAAEGRARAAAQKQAQEQEQTQAKKQTEEVVAALRGLGCRADEARRAAELAQTLPGAMLEERIRAALQSLGGRSIHACKAAEVPGRT